MSVEIETSSTWFAHNGRQLVGAALLLTVMLVSPPAHGAPTLLYSTYFGGSGFEDARAVATDSEGNVYVVGSTGPGLFPIRSALQPVYGGGTSDAFVCKLRGDGSAIVYATFLGGADADVATSVAVDSSGAVLVVGNTLSTDFPLSAAAQAAPAGGVDGFFLKLNPAGSALGYSSYFGGSGDDFPSAVVVDGVGAARIVGSTFSPDLPTVAPFQASLGGQGDGFVAFVSPPGAVTLSSYWGGAGNDTGTGIALGPSGAVHVVGASSGGFPMVNAFQGTFAGGGFDAVVGSVTPSGALARSSYLGGAGRDEAAAVAVTPAGSTVVVGFSMSSDFPGAAAGFQPVRGGGADAFVAEIGVNGDGVLSSSYLGGAGNDRAQGVVVDTDGVIHVVGFTDSSNFPLVESPQPALGGGVDGFLTQINAGRLLHSAYLGGSGTDRATGVALSTTTKTSLLVGNTASTNFPTQSALYGSRIGSQDAFVRRYSGQAPKSAPWGDAWMIMLLAGSLAALVFIRSRKETFRHASSS
jgi:Beta-propeller repeat